MFITFQISAKLYSGFQCKINKNICNLMSYDDIIKYIKIDMKSFFKNPHDLYILREGVDELNLHFHDPLPFSSDNIIYVCDHCH
jgi:hypothetical protein